MKKQTNVTPMPKSAVKRPTGDIRAATAYGKRVKKKFRIFSVRSGMDLPFLFLVLVLLIIGLIMMFSASYANAFYRHNGNSYFFISKQAVFALMGVIIMIAVSYFDYHHFHELAIPILLISYALLVLVRFMPAISGVHRWISLGPFGQFQPSEIAKFSIVLIFAHLISLNFNRMGTFRYGVLPYALILGMTAALLMWEPHVSATVIITLLGGVMLFIGGVKLRWFVGAFSLLGAGVAYLVLFAKEFSYANDRIIAWLDPFSNATPELIADTWQTRQSLYAIGSGGLLGLGLGQSRQKFLYLPEPQNDFVFAIVCEELGFIGALIIIILFAMLIWRGINISLHAKDKFGMLLGIGIVVQVGLQVILNIAVVTNTIPNTGISLPFFSYGGTSLVILLAEMGIVLSISRTAAIEKI
ncbi:MAG: Peptodoglycan polymerase FtsW/RodA/SpoVE [Clostridium sp.]